MSEEAIWAWLQHPPQVLPWPSRGPKGMPRPWHPKHGACHALAVMPLPPHAACMLGPWLRAPRGPAACAQGHASMPTQACHGLCCVPWPWLLHACPCLGCCMPACTPRRIAPHRPALRQNLVVPFSIFVSLNSFHDFRGGFQQAVRRSERF